MKKFILSFVLTIGMSALSFANDIQESENPPRFWICTIESDTDDGDCCVQIGVSFVSGTDACENALNEPC
ncbi:hypothetical protein [Flavobacterium sp.]|jgi:hypothetical protein|uniref:hypothetical protein n=1 Tax=Flavobacterium sp. TaxID=239 RepID=UPI0037BFC3EC